MVVVGLVQLLYEVGDELIVELGKRLVIYGHDRLSALLRQLTSTAVARAVIENSQDESILPRISFLGYSEPVTLETYTFSTVADVLTHLLSSADAKPRWFRGHGCSTHTLLPSLYRRLTSPEPAVIIETEKRLITRFRQRSLPWWPEGYPQDDWEHLFAMQHYGVPTRLLDWSENALAGLYFAGDYDQRACTHAGSCTPTLWVLDPLELNSQNPRRSGMQPQILTSSDDTASSWAPGVLETIFAPSPIAIYGTHNSRRIAAQQGTFTVGGKDAVALESSPLGMTDGVLTRIDLEMNHNQIHDALKVLGVTRSTIYPDLPGLARDIINEEIGR